MSTAKLARRPIHPSGWRRAIRPAVSTYPPRTTVTSWKNTTAMTPSASVPVRRVLMKTARAPSSAATKAASSEKTPAAVPSVAARRSEAAGRAGGSSDFSTVLSTISPPSDGINRGTAAYNAPPETILFNRGGNHADALTYDAGCHVFRRRARRERSGKGEVREIGRAREVGGEGASRREGDDGDDGEGRHPRRKPQEARAPRREVRRE